MFSVVAPHRNAKSIGLSGHRGTRHCTRPLVLTVTGPRASLGRFMFELKAKSLNMRKTLDEIDKAVANRNASPAWRSSDEATTGVSFHYADNRSAVIRDRDGLDHAGARLAHMWRGGSFVVSWRPWRARTSTSLGSTR